MWRRIQIGGCTFGGVHILCIYSHATWSYRRRLRSLLLCSLSLRILWNGTWTPKPSQRKGTSDSICCGSSDLLMSIQLFLNSFIILLLRVFWLFLLFTDFIILMLSKGTYCREQWNFCSQIICDQVGSSSLFCDHLMLHNVQSVLKDPEHAL